MPREALAVTEPDHVAPLAEIPQLIAQLVATPAGRRRDVPEDIKLEVGIAARGSSDLTLNDTLGRRSTFGCPSCGGVLWEIEDRSEIRYRCHTGHAFTASALDSALGDDLHRAMASAIRALDERAGLLHRLARMSREHRHAGAAKSWEAKARGYEEQAQLVRRALRQIATTNEAVPDKTDP
jgi:two-component system chemotaxis response regulator CheB